MSDNILPARRRRGMQRGRLTLIERESVDLEEKAELVDQDQRMIERLIEQIMENEADFEQRRLEVLGFVKEGDEDTLQREEDSSKSTSIE